MKLKDIPQFSRANYAVDHTLNMLPQTIERYRNEKPKLNTEPDYQRAHVWNATKQTRYVEFLLRGGVSSRNIYLNCPGWMDKWQGPFELVDGKQRLEACLGFMANKVPVFGGLYLSDFEDNGPSNLISLRFHINNLPTRAEVLQWYLDLNDGGVIHTEDELNKVRQMLAKEMR